MDLPCASSPDDVLAQPTRARLFSILGELKRPAGTVELAERLALHPNGVRVHLERLENAGLVARSHAPHTRGRPRDAWTIAPDARPGGARPSAYADLGRWLARAIPARAGALDDLEATGRDIGRELAPGNAELDGAAPLETTLAALGFQPHAEPGSGERMTYRLGNCPYRDATHENRTAVCTLHRGMTRGLLDVLEPQAKLAGFVPGDPDTGGCLIELTGVTAPPADK